VKLAGVYVLCRTTNIIMSVNEVKYKSSGVEPLTIKGPDPTARTFCLGHQDHTIGNAVRHVMMQNDNVEFAGYSVPHPSEPIVQVRVQTRPGTTANECLKQACLTLQQQCDVMRQKLEDKLPYVKEDREHIEKVLLEQQQMEEEEDDDEDAMEMS